MAKYISTPVRVGMIKGRQEGMQKGISGMLTRTLQRRFGTVSATVLEKIQQADIDTLLKWEERIVDAKTLEEINQLTHT